MKLVNINQVHDFLKTVEKCKGDVWLESQQGDKFNLKSPMSSYVAMGALLSERGSELELFCSQEDAVNFYKFFDENPEVL